MELDRNILRCSHMKMTRQLLDLPEFDTWQDGKDWMETNQMLGEQYRAVRAELARQRDAGEKDAETANDWLVWLRRIERSAAVLRAGGEVQSDEYYAVIGPQKRYTGLSLAKAESLRARLIKAESIVSVLRVVRSASGEQLVPCGKRALILPGYTYQVFNPLTGKHTRVIGRQDTLAVIDDVRSSLRTRAERRYKLYRILVDVEGLQALERV